MDVVLSEECQKQILIIKELGEFNKDFAALHARIALYVKALQEANNIDELEFGKNDRHINNRLSGDQSDIASRDLDPRQRMAYFDKDNNAVIVTTLGHYNIELTKQRFLFSSYTNQVNEVKKMPPDDFSKLKIKSKPFVEHLISVAKKCSSNINIQEFNLLVQSEYICPVSLDTVTRRLKKDVAESVNNNHVNLDQAVLDFFKKNNNVISDTTVNARGLGNVASVLISNHDLKKLLLTKLEIEKTIIKHFSDLAFYVNKCCGNSHGREMLVLIANNFLKSYDKIYDQKVGLSNDKCQGLNFRHDYEIIRRMDERLRHNIRRDLENSISNIESTNALNNDNKTEFFCSLFPETRSLTSILHEACRKLDLLPNGKSRESHESLCNILGIEKGTLLKRNDRENRINQSQQNNQEVSKIKKERKIKKGHSK